MNTEDYDTQQARGSDRMEKIHNEGAYPSHSSIHTTNANPVINTNANTNNPAVNTTNMSATQEHTQPMVQVKSSEQFVAFPVIHNYTPNPSKPSLYHQAKRAFSGTRPEFDNDYVSLRNHHHEISTTLTRLQNHFTKYTDLARSTYSEGNLIANDMTSLLNDQSAQYSTTMSTAADVHYEIAASSSTVITESLISPEIRGRIDELLNRCQELGRRMKEHEEFKSEVDYYCNKVEKLRNDKNGLAPGIQKPKLDERLDRNVEKYQSMHFQYSENHAKMLQDLADLWLNRAQTLGPIFARFVLVEREVAKRHFDMLNTIDVDKFKDIPSAPISSYPAYCTSPANFQVLNKNRQFSQEILPVTEHSVSEGHHLDNDDHIGAVSGLVVDSNMNKPVENSSGAAFPVDPQLPSSTAAPTSKPIAPPRPPRPVHNLTLVPGTMDTRAGMNDNSPLTPPHEIPPHSIEHHGFTQRTMPLSASALTQLEDINAQSKVPRSEQPLKDASQPLLQGEQEGSFGGVAIRSSLEGNQGSHADQAVNKLDLNASAGSYSTSLHDSHIAKSNEPIHKPNEQMQKSNEPMQSSIDPGQPIRTLSDLIRKNSRAAPGADLHKEGITHSDQTDKVENAHLSSESRDERLERQAAVFPPSQPQTQTLSQSQSRSNVIEYY